MSSYEVALQQYNRITGDYDYDGPILQLNVPDSPPLSTSPVSVNVREQRLMRRRRLRNIWLNEQESVDLIQRQAAAEVRGAQWILDRRANYQSTRNFMLYERKPLGKWCKGKVWSKAAEMYV